MKVRQLQNFLFSKTSVDLRRRVRIRVERIFTSVIRVALDYNTIDSDWVILVQGSKHFVAYPYRGCDFQVHISEMSCAGITDYTCKITILPGQRDAC